MRPRVRSAIVAIMLIVTVAASSVAAQTTKRIRFWRGATSAVVTGTLNGYRSGRRYVIRVRAGQTLTTRQVGSTHPITIFITDSAGQEVGDSDASCNNRREITPTVAGDYRIRVVECRKADPWPGRFRFRISVTS